jgi:hypothetical protein
MIFSGFRSPFLSLFEDEFGPMFAICVISESWVSLPDLEPLSVSDSVSEDSALGRGE